MDSRQPRHRPLAFVGFVVRTTWPQVSVAEPLTETHEGFAGGGAVLLALLAHVAAGFRAAVQQHPGAAGGVVDLALAGGGGGGGGWRGRRGLLRRAVWKSSVELVPGYYR